MSKPKVGREYQHLEDLTFIEGSHGALAAVDFLEKLAEDSSSICLKWDGSNVVYWGRNNAGNFVLSTKNSWGKCEATEPEQLVKFIMSTGKNEPWREQFANHMQTIFYILEQATPHWARGYVKGDVLWHPGKACEVENNQILFTPNLVTYCVDKDSKLGQRILNSQLGIAVHGMYLAFGSSHSEPVQLLNWAENTDVVLFGQTLIKDKVYIDQPHLSTIKSKVLKSSSDLDSLLSQRSGLADIKNIIYTYVNYLVKHDQLHMIEHLFETWVENSSLSKNKKEKLLVLCKEHNKLKIIFELVKELYQIKETVIKQFDEIHLQKQEVVKFKNFGEGYVCVDRKIKLVPRTQWKPR